MTAKDYIVLAAAFAAIMALLRFKLMRPED